VIQFLVQKFTFSRLANQHLVYFVSIFWGILLPQFLFGGVHRISSGDQITVIVTKAEPGDTLFIYEGDYFENLDINKPLVILGINYPHIRGNYKGHVILIRASGTVIDGLKISESGTRLIEDMACVRIEADSVTIRNNIITRPLHGIYVKGGSYTIISDNYIEGRLDLISADRGNGIHLWNSQNNKLYQNNILNVRDGIYFSFADKTEVYQNHIHSVRYGLHYMYSNENTFTENIFENNVAGAALMYSQKIFFDKNTFARCRGFRAYGILYQSMDNTRAIDNLIIDNSRGVYFNNCNFNLFENNDVVDNDLALQLNGSCSENTLIKNNFINNLSSLLVDRKEIKTTWADKTGGNYWSDYQGYDLDGDGFGDVPHKIQNVFQVIETRIPEIRFFLFSPAAEILEIAERTLPILELGTEIDPLPLFKPTQNNNVPWNKAGGLKNVSNLPLAIIYMVIGIIPYIFLLYLSRRQG
jgi:nitrous oxidase accessory protein